MHGWIVVGAGPAGLSAAAALIERGSKPLVLEQGDTVGSAWRERRYDRLHLHTVRWLSGLPGLAIPRSYGRWVSRDDFVRYLDAYARRFGVEPRLGVSVERIDRRDGAWRLTTSEGSLDARRVVVATGYSNVPRPLDWPGIGGYSRDLVHSVEYRNAAPYRDRDVLVIGTGNSGAEIAVDLVDGGAAKVRLSVRTPPNIVRRERFGIPAQVIGIALGKLPRRTLNPIGRTLRRLTVPDLRAHGWPAPHDGFTQVLRTGTIPILDVGIVDAVRSGTVEIVPAVEAFDGDEVVLADRSRIAPECVIAAIGFRPGLERLVGHLGVLDERGTPVVHGRATHPDAPGLHFAGIELTLSGLLRTAARDARAVRRRRRRRRPTRRSREARGP
ncbi:MAG: flavin-containing monooxygenase [Gaiellaceae bacterium]